MVCRSAISWNVEWDLSTIPARNSHSRRLLPDRREGKSNTSASTPDTIRTCDLRLEPGFSRAGLSRVLTRSRILEEVWGFDFPTSGNALEVYVGYLRRKTEADGELRLIHTVRGVGYVLRETPP